MQGICIRCGKTTTLVESHVVSKLLRNRFYKIVNKPGKYDLAYGDTPPGMATPSNVDEIRWRNAQDLPKPPLMCGPCDNGFSAIESKLGSAIDTARFAEDPQAIYSESCVVPTSLHGLDGFMEYTLDPVVDGVMKRVGVLTCWRALHTIAKKSTCLSEYLSSQRGARMEELTLAFLDTEDAPAPGFFWLLIPPIPLTLELGGGDAAAPFGWDAHVIEDNNSSPTVYVVSVWFAHWMLLWVPDPVHEDPSLSETIANEWAARIAATWPEQILKPRVHAAAASLRRQ